MTDEFPTLTPYQYASNDPVANIDWDGLEGLNAVTDASKLLPGMAFGVVNSTAVVISAAKPLTTSLKVVKGASVLSKVESRASSALHLLQSVGTVTMSATRQVGHAVGTGYNELANGHFWNTGVGRAAKTGGSWINETINPVYLLFNGINS
ncbi:MAG: hypothetical protein EPN39_16740 [Chitinophagaceae bacterium]|nr:MAG: hypothetical protein EPN39_16740 [Chitinophagaceae bacterium]